MADEIEFWVSGEWTMVYLNGELQRAGDHYLADEWLQSRCGVKVVEDDGKFSIPDGRNAIKSLAEVKASMETAEEKAIQAEELRRQAEALMAEANRLDPS